MDHARAHAVPRPKAMLTQEVQWDQEIHGQSKSDQDAKAIAQELREAIQRLDQQIRARRSQTYG
jgi:hypothetical protein